MSCSVLPINLCQRFNRQNRVRWLVECVAFLCFDSHSTVSEPRRVDWALPDSGHPCPARRFPPHARSQQLRHIKAAAGSDGGEG